MTLPAPATHAPLVRPWTRRRLKGLDHRLETRGRLSSPEHFMTRQNLHDAPHCTAHDFPSKRSWDVA
eukprot:76656-Pyramimonas_sp.AAC.1